MLQLEKIKDFDALIKVNQEIQTDGYIKKNRGYVTASKLKDFMKSPEFYFRKYILEQNINGEEKTCFKLGTAIDDFISYGEEKFYEKYFIDEGLLKWDLEKLAIEKGIPLGAKETVKTLKEKIYGDDKIRLTAWEGQTVTRVLKEFNRQKLFDKETVYETQKTFTGKYKSLDLLGTLDRYRVITEEKNGKIYVHIRDTKTTGNIRKFKFQAVEELGYDTSMSFYNLLAILELKREHDNQELKVDVKLTLDVCQTTGQYPSRFVHLPPELVDGKIQSTIIPALETLNTMTEYWEKNKDPKIWLVKTPFEDTIDLDLYGEMETTIQEEFDWLE